jgi:hypothetical protein
VNPIERSIRAISAASLKSSGDQVEVFNTVPDRVYPVGARLTTVDNEPLEPISLVVTYEYDLLAKPGGKIDLTSFKSFRHDLEQLGLDVTEVMTALTLATIACR